jgi:hypothetical protein
MHYKHILNAPLRPILIRNNIIYALYNILSNWSRGTISLLHLGPKRLQIAGFTPTKTNPNDHYYYYCSWFLWAELGLWLVHLRTLPRHVRVARGPREWAHASGQGHCARVCHVLQQDHMLLPENRIVGISMLQRQQMKIMGTQCCNTQIFIYLVQSMMAKCITWKWNFQGKNKVLFSRYSTILWEILIQIYWPWIGQQSILNLNLKQHEFNEYVLSQNHETLI